MIDTGFSLKIEHEVGEWITIKYRRKIDGKTFYSSGVLDRYQFGEKDVALYSPVDDMLEYIAMSQIEYGY